MKFKFIILISYLYITPGFAQENIVASGKKDDNVFINTSETQLIIDDNETINPEVNDLPDGIMLQGTTMIQVKNGFAIPMERDVILSNGTRVRKDGYFFRKNKPKMLLNIDEYIDISGKIHPITKTNSFINN